MRIWIAITILVVLAIALILWLIYEIRMDRIAQKDRDEWAELTRPPVDRWPPKNDL
jgi:uncharacterized protein with PQ loop repeat